MKGKIYKNRLSSSNLNQQINQQLNLYTDISSIYHPLGQNGSFSQLPSTLGKNNQSRQNKVKNCSQSSNKQENNNQFIFANKSRTAINEPIPKRVPNGVTNYIQQYNRGIPQGDRFTNNSSVMLKRALSNPNLTSHLIWSPQNRQQQIDLTHQNQALNNSSMLRMANYNTRTTQQKGNNKLQSNVVRPGLSNNNNNRASVQSQFNGQQQFASTDQLYTLGVGTSPVHSNNQNHFLETSNLMLLNNTLQNVNKNQGLFGSQYIANFQKNHKQRVTTLESQHQLQIHFFEQQIRAKDQTIEQMKRLLKQKQEIIRRLQSQNTNLSNRSYASFSNGNNYKQ